MKYESTRGGLEKITGAEAIIKGIADDKGLYVPVQIPGLPLSIKEMEGMSYQQIAYEIIHAFFDDYTENEMKACIDGAYDSKFEAEEIAPLTEAGGAWFLELYHGKTAAFKDMALSILPYLMTTACRKVGEKDKICILTATSGDTGKAALEGFAKVDGTEIIVFYPENGVSQVQERQMVSQEGENTHVVAIKGNFDDAQTGVKKIFSDDEMKEKLARRGIKLSSANSINIGRLVPQVAYYVYAYVKLVEKGAVKEGEPVNITVPTGNFGNILAAYLAKEMGLPVKKLICASNENKVLTDFIRTGTYDARREFHLTSSPSMDILISSNLERLLFLLSGRDGHNIRNLMESLDREKVYSVSDEIKEGMKDFYGGFCTEEDTAKTIASLWQEEKYLTDTHTAVAYKVYRDYVKETGDETPAIIASTASAYKFAPSVASACGIDDERVKSLTCAGTEPTGFDYVRALEKVTGVKVPSGLKDLDTKPVLHNKVCGKDQMENAVLEALD